MRVTRPCSTPAPTLVTEAGRAEAARMGVAGWAFVSAEIFALGTVLQQKGAMEAPPANTGGFIGSLFSKPVWLAGGVCQVLGFVTQAIALDKGKLFFVQPIISLQVVIALPLGILITSQ